MVSVAGVELGIEITQVPILAVDRDLRLEALPRLEELPAPSVEAHAREAATVVGAKMPIAILHCFFGLIAIAPPPLKPLITTTGSGHCRYWPASIAAIFSSSLLSRETPG